MNNAITAPIRTGNALEYALTGVSRSRDQFHQAAVETVDSFAAQANAMSSGGETALSSEAFVSAINSDPTTSMVDMIRAQRAFEANLKVFKEVDETQKSVIDMMT